MSSPLELIRNGILSGSWSEVVDGFAKLTGERLEAPGPSPASVSIPDVSDRLLLAIGKAAYDAATSAVSQAFEPVLVGNEKAKRKPGRPKKVQHEAPAPPPAPPPRDDLSRFEIQHAGPARTDGKRNCRVEPFAPPKANQFADDRTLAAEDINDSIELSKRKAPAERRPPVPLVNVTCVKCGVRESVEPIFSPRYGGESASYVCNGCIKRGER